MFIIIINAISDTNGCRAIYLMSCRSNCFTNIHLSPPLVFGYDKSTEIYINRQASISMGLTIVAVSHQERVD